MLFVYSLIDDGKVFYIGCAKDLSIRYSQHCRKGEGLNTFYYIQNMMLEGRTPIIHIISYLPAQEARMKEGALIRLMVACGHKLCNNSLNDLGNIIVPERNELYIKKRLTKYFLNSIKEMQLNYIRRNEA